MHSPPCPNRLQHLLKSSGSWRLLAVVAVGIVAATAAWRFTPLAAWASPEHVASWLDRFEAAAWAPLVTIAAFVVGGLVLFPLLLLIAATAMVFDPPAALGCSLVGALANASVTYAVGAKLLRGTVHRALGDRMTRVSALLARGGIVAVTVARTLPLAPFSVLNVAAGSIGVRFRDYLIGTALGVAPGMLAVTAFGRQLRNLLSEPTPAGVALLVAVALCLWGSSLLLQRLVRRHAASDARPRIGGR